MGCISEVEGSQGLIFCIVYVISANLWQIKGFGRLEQVDCGGFSVHVNVLTCIVLSYFCM